MLIYKDQFRFPDKKKSLKIRLYYCIKIWTSKDQKSSWYHLQANLGT